MYQSIAFSDKYASIRKRHNQIFNNETPDRPPLQVEPIVPGGKSLSFEEKCKDPGASLANQLARAKATLEMDSDSIPVVAAMSDQHGIVPSICGAILEEHESLWVQPIECEIPELLDMVEKADLNGGLMPDIENNLKYFIENAPSWVHVLGAVICCPLETAALLRGPEKFLLEIVTDPDEVFDLLDALTTVHIHVIKRMKEILNEPDDRMVSWKGTYLPVTRMASDSMVNLSPALIDEFCSPCLNRIGKALGSRLHMHYCSIKTHPGRHVFKALESCETVAGINSMYCAFTDEWDIPTIAESVGNRFTLTMDFLEQDSPEAFRTWTEELAQRWKPPYSIIPRIWASSIDEGKQRIQIWKDVWGQ